MNELPYHIWMFVRIIRGRSSSGRELNDWGLNEAVGGVFIKPNDDTYIGDGIRRLWTTLLVFTRLCDLRTEPLDTTEGDDEIVEQYEKAMKRYGELYEIER